MKTTIDAAGRLVIPKEIRDLAHLEAGHPVEVRYTDGRIEIEPAPRQVRIVSRGRVRVALPAEGSAPLGESEVRRVRDRLRGRGD